MHASEAVDALLETASNDTRALIVHGVRVPELVDGERLAALLDRASPPVELVVTSDLDADELPASDAVLGVPAPVSGGGEPIEIGAYEDLVRRPPGAAALFAAGAVVDLPPAAEPRPAWDVCEPGAFLVAAGPLPRASLVFG